MPYFDGERTPNLPNAAASITGLRHSTTPGEILLAAYQGAALSLLEVVEVIDRHSSGIGAEAPVILIGGGARGTTWQRVIRELSGRPVHVPDSAELVALGAAAQAAAMITGVAPDEIARRWNTRRGTVLEPIPRDRAAIERMRLVRSQLAALNG
jgi:xylulokinase